MLYPLFLSCLTRFCALLSELKAPAMRKKLPEAFVDPEVLPPLEEVRVVFVLLGVVGSLVVVLVVVLGVSVVPATCAFFLSAACFFKAFSKL